jgi:hypothetical protein
VSLPLSTAYATDRPHARETEVASPTTSSGNLLKYLDVPVGVCIKASLPEHYEGVLALHSPLILLVSSGQTLIDSIN